jgi:hypothetical protein
MYTGDRLGLMIREFGRKVVIDIRLGKAVWDKKRKRLTVAYDDSQYRTKKAARGSKKPAARL